MTPLLRGFLLNEDFQSMTETKMLYDLAMIDNIIFDLDGTLLDTIEDIDRALNETLAVFGFSTITLTQTRSFIGDGTDKLIARALGKATMTPTEQRAFKNQYLALQLRYQLERAPAFPGITRLVERLVKLGMRLYVFSNKPHDFAVKLIETRFPNMFLAILGQKDGAVTKPDTAAFESVMATHHIDPGASLYVGDSLVDVQTGRNLKMATATVTWGYAIRETLVDARPDFVVDTAEQLFEIVAGARKQLLV